MKWHEVILLILVAGVMLLALLSAIDQNTSRIDALEQRQPTVTNTLYEEYQVAFDTLKMKKMILWPVRGWLLPSAYGEPLWLADARSIRPSKKHGLTPDDVLIYTYYCSGPPLEDTLNPDSTTDTVLLEAK